MSAKKHEPVKGHLNVREQAPHLEAHPEGNRAQRRLWAKLHGQRTAAPNSGKAAPLKGAAISQPGDHTDTELSVASDK